MQSQQELKREQELRADDAPQELSPTAVVAEHKAISSDIATRPACAQDVAAFCQKEANIVALLREAPDMVEPRKIVEAVRKVRLCMITHVEVLSTDCVNTLSADVAGAAPTMAASVPAKSVAALDSEGVDDDSSMEINIYYSRHHNGAGHALRSGGALAANHVQTGGPSSNLAQVLAHPLTWAFVLPFFAIGMYVSITRMATFLRRRREERRIESKQYMPVN
ncbi:hypothetical protein F441_11672 [Phytophthora nicotianae CJ01A1]|uniref:Transmembrane protein n=5 Tax=Phytophthora nicotianae TaxID=4792 RepID=W2Q1H0_PHYN3|nr:hypothetical protein PPTG_12935 [Phytophthora nicotianae INRA-310]ETK83378.1 hypothetical protein L915_11428 [Phytophthora nicotianae]ETO71961.1 hypothetical protein F444_11822 [Phytophthora nicotianae P1976]ETP13093.1 hypothetical protein F441_11672 [Phytophthora nicotianae CJ01A1]ETP41182.1 hypothetical protein F442_11640 [Phytophthora nicotianae P10297]KUF94295.1 hypothetical protein AM587_10014277 [Phytophthora nicotianae]